MSILYSGKSHRATLENIVVIKWRGWETLVIILKDGVRRRNIYIEGVFFIDLPIESLISIILYHLEVTKLPHVYLMCPATPKHLCVIISTHQKIYRLLFLNLVDLLIHYNSSNQFQVICWLSLFGNFLHSYSQNDSPEQFFQAKDTKRYLVVILPI